MPHLMTTGLHKPEANQPKELDIEGIAISDYQQVHGNPCPSERAALLILADRPVWSLYA